MHHGPGTLSDGELLAILIQTGVGNASAVDLATTLLREYRSLERLTSRTFRDLRQFKGLGNAKSSVLIAAFEVGRRAASRREPRGRQISSPEDVVRQYR